MSTRKRIAVLTGAGISAESGISTFRDSDGLWNNFRVEDVATPEGFARNPQMVLDFYNSRHAELEHTQPNAAHEILAKLQDEFEVDIITQNIDDLHERAGSKSVLHLHGELTKARSTRNDELIVEWPYGKNIKPGDKAPDGSQLRPHIVWFGEAVPNITKAEEIVGGADIMLIVGTSLKVYPAAGLVAYAADNAPIYLVDPKAVEVKDIKNLTVIKDVATKGVAKFAELISTKKASGRQV